MIVASRAVRGDRRLTAGRDYRACNATRGALLAELEQQVGQFAFGQRVDQIGGGRPVRPIRMSSGPSRAEREAARRIVELERRHAEIEHHAIQCGDAVLCQQIQHVAELAIDQVQPTGKARGEAGATSDCLGIAVDRPDRAGRSLQDSRGIAAAAERAVEIDAAVARARAAGQHFRQHDGNVASCVRQRTGAGQREAMRRVPVRVPRRAGARLLLVPRSGKCGRDP